MASKQETAAENEKKKFTRIEINSDWKDILMFSFMHHASIWILYKFLITFQSRFYRLFPHFF